MKYILCILCILCSLKLLPGYFPDSDLILHGIVLWLLITAPQQRDR